MTRPTPGVSRAFPAYSNAGSAGLRVTSNVEKSRGLQQSRFSCSGAFLVSPLAKGGFRGVDPLRNNALCSKVRGSEHRNVECSNRAAAPVGTGFPGT